MCGVCKVVCSTAEGLKRYIKYRHKKELGTMEGRKYACETCGARFREQSRLKRHALKHSGERQYGCNLCVKRFTRKDKLRRHSLKLHKMESGFGLAILVGICNILYMCFVMSSFTIIVFCF